MDIHNLTASEKIDMRKYYMHLDFPHSFNISLGEWPCNNRCRMCPMYRQMPSNVHRMDKSVFLRICDIIGNRDNIELAISAYGETYQHPLADDFLDIAHKKCPHAYIVVATNGTLLNKERCIRIVESGINHLSFSLDAGSAKSYEWLTQNKNYDKVCANLECLVETRNKRNAKHLRITTHIIGIEQLKHEFDSFLQRWSPVVDSAVVRPLGNWAGLINENDITPASSQNIPDYRYPCAWPWYATAIDYDGSVMKCCMDYPYNNRMSLGNIVNDDFSKIWNGEKMKTIRKYLLNNLEDKIFPCKTCSAFSLFPNFWNRKKRFFIIPTKEWC